MSARDAWKTQIDQHSDDRRGEKRHAEGEHPLSANEWEKAELGDDERKQKFLRLMGAKKTSHQGKIVIGDHEAHEHGRSVEDTEKMCDALASQYTQGMEHRLVQPRHGGLGFHRPEPATAAAEGDKTEGDETEGDKTEGDETEGDKAVEGDKTEADKAEADKAEANSDKKSDNSSSVSSSTSSSLAAAKEGHKDEDARKNGSPETPKGTFLGFVKSSK